MQKMTDKEYFALDRASNSTLGRMRRSPAHCRHYLDNPPEPSAAMELGTLVHCLVLEPDEFESRYHVMQEGEPTAPRTGTAADGMIKALLDGTFESLYWEGETPRKLTGKALEVLEAYRDGADSVKKFVTEPTNINKRTKEGKEKFSEFQAKCEREGLTVVKDDHLEAASKYWDWECRLGDRTVAGFEDASRARNYVQYLNCIDNKILISAARYAKALDMSVSVMAHPVCQKLFAFGQAEMVVLWDDPETNYPCKAKIDFVSSMGYLVDLKTTRDASLGEFSRSIAKFGYHRQDAMHMDGYESDTGAPAGGFVFVSVESEAPHAVGVYVLDQDGREQGRMEYKYLLTEFSECKNSGEWPAYSNDVETIELPRWYK